MPKTAPFSSSVAFLTTPTFPAPAPRKRFFDPLPKKILGFRTRKGRLPRRQYLARARLEFRAGLRVVVSSRARAFVSPAACWPVGLADGWPLWRRMARAGAAPVRLRGMVFLRGPARLVSPAPARLAALADGWPSCRLQELAADLPTVCPPCRHAAPIGAARPDRLPPVDDLPPRPPAAPVCRSAAGQAGAAAEGIYRARYRPRIS